MKIRTLGKPLDRPLSTFDLGRALVDLRAEEAFTRVGRNAVVLHKEDGLKVVLMAMREGDSILSHKAPAPISVQLLEGSVQFNTEKESLRARRGESSGGKQKASDNNARVHQNPRPPEIRLFIIGASIMMNTVGKMKIIRGISIFVAACAAMPVAEPLGVSPAFVDLLVAQAQVPCTVN